MSMNIKRKSSVADTLDERVPEAELEAILSARHDEVEALLEEGRTAKAERRFAPLEPLHNFLRRARERLLPKN